MGKETGLRGAGLVLCLVVSAGPTPAWVQAQEQAQDEAQAATQSVVPTGAQGAAEGAKPATGPRPPSAQESAELAEPAESTKLAERIGPVVPAEPAPPTKTMTLALAEQFLDAAKVQAHAEGWRMSLAVVDTAGNLVAMIRMDGARWMTAQVAQAKAFTAVTFRRPSAAVEELAEKRPDLFKSLVTLIDRPLLLAGGGLPLMINGALLGGVGVSGGTEDQDVDCAEAGLNAIGVE